MVLSDHGFWVRPPRMPARMNSLVSSDVSPSRPDAGPVELGDEVTHNQVRARCVEQQQLQQLGTADVLGQLLEHPGGIWFAEVARGEALDDHVAESARRDAREQARVECARQEGLRLHAGLVERQQQSGLLNETRARLQLGGVVLRACHQASRTNGKVLMPFRNASRYTPARA